MFGRVSVLLLKWVFRAQNTSLTKRQGWRVQLVQAPILLIVCPVDKKKKDKKRTLRPKVGVRNTGLKAARVTLMLVCTSGSLSALPWS